MFVVLYYNYNKNNIKECDIDVYIQLNFESDKPIYTQLVEQIIAGIAKEELLPGERLPSVRSLAADVGINLHTVNKAYQELRQRGFILIHRQRGVVIHPDGPPLADDLYVNTLQKSLHPLIAESICRGISRDEFIQLSQEIFAEYEKKEGDK